MNIMAQNSVAFSATIKPTIKPTITANKMINRKLLKPATSRLSSLNGPEEKRRAKNWVAGYTAGNAGIAGFTAQAGGLEEFLLAAVEVIMATHILNGIYDFKLSKTALKNIAAGASGHVIGKATFKWASKSLTWIPGLGNGLNAIVAGTTTAAIGAYLIDVAEKMEQEIKRNKSLDEFIKRLKG